MIKESVFVDFLKNIEPSSKTTKSEVASVQSSIRDYLKHNDLLRNDIIEDFLSGSYAKQTAVRPSKYSEKGDVDIIIVFRGDNQQDSKDIFRKLRMALEDSGRYDNIRTQHHSVRVEMRGLNIDLVPAVYGADSKLYVGSSEESSWQETDPKGHLAWATETNKNSGGYFKPLVKIMKWWRRKNCPKNLKYPKGITLEKLIADNMPISFSGYRELIIGTFENIVSKNSFYVANRLVSNLPDPCLPENNLLDSYDVDEFKSFIDKLSRHLALLKESDGAWQDVFGKELRSDTQKDVFEDTEEFAEDKFIMNPVLELRLDAMIHRNGFRSFLLSTAVKPIGHDFKIDFVASFPPRHKPFDVYWKIRNVGQEAERRNDIRGRIIKTNSLSKREHSTFNGPHFAECYIVKDGICIAKNRISVPIKE